MTNTFMRLAGTSAFALSLLVTPAAAQETFPDWDADGNAAISSEEFSAGFGDSGGYEAWDTDGDGNLTKEEFIAGVFSVYDRDDSGAIEEAEFGELGDAYQR